jgi:hypothetical protein
MYDSPVSTEFDRTLLWMFNYETNSTFIFMNVSILSSVKWILFIKMYSFFLLEIHHYFYFGLYRILSQKNRERFGYELKNVKIQQVHVICTAPFSGDICFSTQTRWTQMKLRLSKRSLTAAADVSKFAVQTLISYYNSYIMWWLTHPSLSDVNSVFECVIIIVGPPRNLVHYSRCLFHGHIWCTYLLQDG